MKRLVVLGIVTSLGLVARDVFAQGTCLTLVCATNKTAECGTTWAYDPPSVTGLCSCGTNYSLTVLSTTTTSTNVCFQFNQQVWQMVDCSGAAQYCTQTVTVVDTTPPVVTCAPDKTVVCGSSWIFDPPTAFDVCSGTSITITVPPGGAVTNLNPNGCGMIASQIWVITDCCGNFTNCNQH